MSRPDSSRDRRRHPPEHQAEDQRDQEERATHARSGARAVAVREQLDRRQPEDEAADVGQVGDAAPGPETSGVATCPIAGRNWSTNQIPSMITAGISIRVTKKMMNTSVNTRARGYSSK